jgi:hypothetical protein
VLLYYINSIRPSRTACFEFEEFVGARLDVFANRLSQLDSRGERRAPVRRNFGELYRRSGNQRSRGLAHHALVALVGDVFDGRFAVAVRGPTKL